MKKIRRSIEIVMLFVGIFLLDACSNSGEQKRPNILFITTENQAWEDVPEKNLDLKLPVIGKLFKEAAVFENHYCAAPLSLPARYSILSGMYPHKHQMMENGGNWLAEGTPVLMEKLSAAGYHTIGIGNMQFRPWERKAGFDKRIIADGYGTGASDTLKQDDYYFFLKKKKYTRWDYLKNIENSKIPGINAWPLSDTLDIDNYIGTQAVNFIRDKKLGKSSNWFLWVSFNGPQYSWSPNVDQTEKYRITSFPAIRSCEGELAQKPFDQTCCRYQFNRAIADATDADPQILPSVLQEIKSRFYGNLSLIDSQVGKILNELKKQGQLDNTIIVFTSTNGSMLGDHNLFQNGVFYERSAHVPLAILWPRHFKNRRINGFTSHTDLFPTFMELAKITTTEPIDGQSLVPVLKGEKKAPGHTFLEVSNDFAVVTGKYKLGFYKPYNEGELYDRKADPNELKNVFGLPEFKQKTDSLTAILQNFYPEMANLLAKRSGYQPLVSKVQLRDGQSLYDNETPYFPGQALNLKVDVQLKPHASGPIVLYSIENVHGFSLYAENGQLCFGIRKWGREEIYRIPEPVSQNRFQLELSIDTSGKMTVNSKGLAKSFCVQTIWPLTVQQGHPQYQSRLLFAGNSEARWIKPYGKLSRGAKLDGVVNSAILTTGAAF